MMRHTVYSKRPQFLAIAFYVLIATLLLSPRGQAQYPAGAMVNGIDTPVLYPEVRPFTRVGVAAKMGTLGAGLEVSTRLSNRMLLHATGSYFSFTHTLTRQGVDYAGTVHLRSMQAGIDWFPFRRGFYFSPGVYFLSDNKATAVASVPAGQPFTLDDSKYQSSLNDPIHGNGSALVNSAGPLLTMGWGSVLPRSRRFSVPFEFGALYDGSPRISLNLVGSGCVNVAQGTFCEPVAQIPGFLDSLKGEQTKLNQDAKSYTVYPILTIGVAYKF